MYVKFLFKPERTTGKLKDQSRLKRGFRDLKMAEENTKVPELALGEDANIVAKDQDVSTAEPSNQPVENENRSENNISTGNGGEPANGAETENGNSTETGEISDSKRARESDSTDNTESQNPGPDNANDDGNNEEEDDDEDEDEDDDDDDEAGPRKKQRRERNRFLDIEAEVSDDDEDEEDEEESELVREGFITRGDEEEEETAGPDNRDDRLHRQLDQNLSKNSEEDAQKLAKELRERYGRSSSKQYRAAAQDGYVPQRFLLPSVDTATIWGVRCRPGREKEIVRKLAFQKKTQPRQVYGQQETEDSVYLST